MDNTELQDFVINDAIEEKKEYTIISSTDELDKFDFSSEAEFDIDSNFELISALKQEEPDESMKEIVKLQEAKNIIEKNAKKFLNPEFVDMFSKEEENLINLIKKFDPNIDEVRDMTEEQKNKIYKIAEYLFNIFQKKLNDLLFYFPLSKEEMKFIFNVFRNKLEYDQNEIFQLKDLKENYLDKEFDKQEDESYMTYINVNNLIIFYHLISKYKVKGITQEHYDYLTVLTKIGERIKLFNAYNIIVQRISTDYMLWGGSLSVEGELVGKVIEPENKETIVEAIDNQKINVGFDGIHVINESTGEVV